MRLYILQSNTEIAEKEREKKIKRLANFRLRANFIIDSNVN